MAQPVPIEMDDVALNGVLPILDQIAIFGGFTTPQLLRVCDKLKRQRCEAGEIIFSEGDAASYIYIVQSGSVNLVFDVYGEAHLKANLQTGSCFGETSLIGIQPHSVTAVAAEDTDLWVLSGDALNDLMLADKDLFSMLLLNIARESCRRLFKTNEQLRKSLSLCSSEVVASILAY